MLSPLGVTTSELFCIFIFTQPKHSLTQHKLRSVANARKEGERPKAEQNFALPRPTTVAQREEDFFR